MKHVRALLLCVLAALLLGSCSQSAPPVNDPSNAVFLPLHLR